MDYYKKFDKLYYAFKKFSSNIPFYGSSIICLENNNSKKLAKEITKRDILTYGISKSEADLNITNIYFKKNKSYFTLTLSSKLNRGNLKKYKFSLNLLGSHNILNAVAAVGASIKIGIKPSIIKKSLVSYKGVQRRFTLLKKIRKSFIYDDYAHHPKEIESSISIAKHLSKKKIIIVFQPHRYSRTKLLLKKFVSVLKNVDVVILSKIYPAGEKKIRNLDNKLFNNLKKLSKAEVRPPVPLFTSRSVSSITASSPFSSRTLSKNASNFYLSSVA